MKWLRAIIRYFFLVKEIISQEGVLHFQRFRLLQLPTFAIYLHHILQSDQDRHPHDHPWHFRSYILSGSYWEQSSYYPRFLTIHSGTYVPGDVIEHNARDVHHITLKTPEVWTLVFVWGKRRVWGYRVNKEWIDFQDLPPNEKRRNITIMSKLKVNDRVVWIERSNLEAHNEYEDDDCTRGIIEGLTVEGKFSVKWDSNWVTPNPSSHSADELMLETRANKILSKLEKEYETYASPIRKKIEKAAKLLEEASQLASEHDRELTDWHDVVAPLIGAMDNIGWSTSSLSC